MIVVEPFPERRDATQGFAQGVALVLGVAMFFMLFEPRLLDPAYFHWLFWLPDPATQFLGWHFFRLENWHMPPGAASDYGMDMGGSIVFTDSIPLLALAFKSLRAALPAHFQYFGPWMLASYLLQAALGWSLAGLFTRLAGQRLMITALFVLCPLLPDRAIGHYALMGHWIILAALYLYLRAPQRHAVPAWAALISVAVLVHAYLAYLALAIAVADVVRRRFVDRSATTLQAMRGVLIVAASLLATMWAAGYFTIPATSFSGGAPYYGRFAANLNALWNPQWGSRFLPGLPVLPGSELEGYNYLGLGVLLLAPVAAFALWRRPPSRRTILACTPVAVVALMLWALALTNQVAWGNRVVFTVPLPEKVLAVLAAVRGSGRMLWVLYYALLIGLPAIVVRCVPRRGATAILALSLVVQIADLSPRYIALRGYFRQHFITEAARWISPLQSPFWSVAANHYRKILFVPAVPIPNDFAAFALLASDHGMKINTGSFARYAVERVAAADAKRVQLLSAGAAGADSLYVIAAPGKTAVRAGPDDAIGVVDGYEVLAPGWFACAECQAALALPAESGHFR